MGSDHNCSGPKCYDGGMSMGALAIVVCGIFGVQPMCTERDFQMALGAAIQGDHGFIARAVFDDYADLVQELDKARGTKKPSQAQQLSDLLRKTIQADALFDELLDSLAVLNKEEAWQMGLVNLRRSILLQARKSNNPWPSTVWVNIPTITPVPKSILLEIDKFLIENIAADIQERFGAASAKLRGDSETCATFEKQAMERWSNYTKIIEPYINSDVEEVLYPQLSKNDFVEHIASWIVTNVPDSSVVSRANLQLAMWKNSTTQKKREVISLICSTRKNFGIDPWSRGCGTQNYSRQSRVKNELLQKTAEMQESVTSTCKVLLGLLTPEQLQLFDEEK